MNAIQYGTSLTNEDEIKKFLRCIGTMKCKCMITFKTLWINNAWLVRGYTNQNEKYISQDYHNDAMANVYDVYSDKYINVSIKDIECLTIEEMCYIRL